MTLVEAANMLLQFANGIQFGCSGIWAFNEFMAIHVFFFCIPLFWSLCFQPKKSKMSDNQTSGRILLNRFKLWFMKFMQIDLEIDSEISLKTIIKGADKKKTID